VASSRSPTVYFKLAEVAFLTRRSTNQHNKSWLCQSGSNKDSRPWIIAARCVFEDKARSRVPSPPELGLHSCCGEFTLSPALSRLGFFFSNTSFRTPRQSRAGPHITRQVEFLNSLPFVFLLELFGILASDSLSLALRPSSSGIAASRT